MADDFTRPFDGRKLRHQREMKKLPQAEMAKQLGVPGSNLSGWENMKKGIPIKHNMQICDILKVPPGALQLDQTETERFYEDMLAQTPRLHYVTANWHLLPPHKQKIILEIVLDHITEMLDMDDLLL